MRLRVRLIAHAHLLKSRLRDGYRGYLVDVRSLMLPGALRELSLTIVRNLWPAYLSASVLILCGFRWSLPNPYQDQSFQMDEAAAVNAVNQIHFPLFNPHAFNWGTGFLYQMYLVKLVFTAGGLIHASDYWMMVMGRLVVFAYALGTVTVLFFLGRKLFDASTGRLAAIILAVLPGFVISSHYLKMDTPLTFWVLVTYQFLDTGNSRLVPLLGFLVGYTATIKYNGGALIFAVCLAMAMASRKFHKPLPWWSYLACVGLGFAFGEPAVLLPHGRAAIIHGLRFLTTSNRMGAPYYVARPPAWIDYAVNVFPISLTMPMLIATMGALACALISQRMKLLPILAFLATFYSLLTPDNWRLVRYTTPILPFAALFVASAVWSLREWPIARQIALVAVSALILYAFTFSLSYVRAMAQLDPRIQASRWIVEHIPRRQPIPETYIARQHMPQLNFLGYKTINVRFSIEDLQRADSPYLLVSELTTSQFCQALDYYPQQKYFFQFVAKNYVEAAHFENSQKLLFIDSKRGSKLSEDWLVPNPRITILVRRNSGNPVLSRADIPDAPTC